MSAQGQAGGGSGVIADVSEAVMLVIVLVLFIVIVLVFFFYLYAKRRVRRTASFVYASERVAPGPSRGLDAVVLRSLPVTVYRAADYKEGVECAVCLTELSEGEKARVLPKCRHGFHLACIDTWFRSDTTCPVCRAPVGSGSAQSSDGSEESAAAPPSRENVPQSPAAPSGVLFLSPEEHINSGNSLQGPSSYAGSLVSDTPAGDDADAHIIEIPSRVTEGAPSPLPVSKPASKSPSPSPKFKSVTRFLGLGKRAAGPSQGPNGADIEQGYGASTPTPRAPTHP